MNKYSLNGFKHLNINTNPDEQEDKSREYVRKTDDHIKKICKNAGFDEEITYTEQRGSKKTTVKKKQHELIHTHVTRHTFITLMCKMGFQKKQ